MKEIKKNDIMYTIKNKGGKMESLSNKSIMKLEEYQMLTHTIVDKVENNITQVETILLYNIMNSNFFNKNQILKNYEIFSRLAIKKYNKLYLNDLNEIREELIESLGHDLNYITDENIIKNVRELIKTLEEPFEKKVINKVNIMLHAFQDNLEGMMLETNKTNSLDNGETHENITQINVTKFKEDSISQVKEMEKQKKAKQKEEARIKEIEELKLAKINAEKKAQEKSQEMEKLRLAQMKEEEAKVKEIEELKKAKQKEEKRVKEIEELRLAQMKEEEAKAKELEELRLAQMKEEEVKTKEIEELRLAKINAEKKAKEIEELKRAKQKEEEKKELEELRLAQMKEEEAKAKELEELRLAQMKEVEIEELKTTKKVDENKSENANTDILKTIESIINTEDNKELVNPQKKKIKKTNKEEENYEIKNILNAIEKITDDTDVDVDEIDYTKFLEEIDSNIDFNLDELDLDDDELNVEIDELNVELDESDKEKPKTPEQPKKSKFNIFKKNKK